MTRFLIVGVAELNKSTPTSSGFHTVTFARYGSEPYIVIPYVEWTIEALSILLPLPFDDELN